MSPLCKTWAPCASLMLPPQQSFTQKTRINHYIWPPCHQGAPEESEQLWLALRDSLNFPNVHSAGGRGCRQTIQKHWAAFCWCLCSAWALWHPHWWRHVTAQAHRVKAAWTSLMWLHVQRQGRWRGEDCDFSDRSTRNNRWNTRCLSVVELFAFQNCFLNTKHARDCKFLSSLRLFSPRITSQTSATASSEGERLFQPLIKQFSLEKTGPKMSDGWTLLRWR